MENILHFHHATCTLSSSLSLSLAFGRVTTGYADQTYSFLNVNYANFNCPSNAGSLSSCSADNVTTVSNCSLGYGGILVVECIIGMSAL